MSRPRGNLDGNYRLDPTASPRPAHVRRYPLRPVFDPQGTVQRLAGWRLAEEN